MPAILLLAVPFFLSSAIPERDQKDKYAIYYYLPPSDLKTYLRLFYVSRYLNQFFHYVIAMVSFDRRIPKMPWFL